VRYSPHAVPDERTREGHGRGGPSGDRGSVRRSAAAVTFVLASTPSGHQNQAAAVDVNAAQG